MADLYRRNLTGLRLQEGTCLMADLYRREPGMVGSIQGRTWYGRSNIGRSQDDGGVIQE
jgi:hypothetical protein